MDSRSPALGAKVVAKAWADPAYKKRLIKDTRGALSEIGIDISAHTSKHMNEFLARDVETVITVCGNADQACPVYPGQMNRHHWPFEDPAHATGTEAERLAVFRRVRDEIAAVFRAYADGRRDGQKAKGGA